MSRVSGEVTFISPVGRGSRAPRGRKPGLSFLEQRRYLAQGAPRVHSTLIYPEQPAARIGPQPPGQPLLPLLSSSPGMDSGVLCSEA